MVEVAVGGNGVAVDVSVGVGLARKPGKFGVSPPVNQMTIRNTPTTTRTTAKPPRITGTVRSRRFL
jgi:hypothetical protein